MGNNSNTWKVNLYNNKHAFVYQYGEELIRILDPKPNERILDLGCGSGQLTNEINRSGAKVVGIDSSLEMIAEAKRNFPELKFFVKNATNFKFEQLFDAIFTNAVLHWVLDSEKAIHAMHGNLKKGGRLILEFGGKGNVNNIITSVKKNLKQRGYIKNAMLENWYFPSISTYTLLLEKNGFEVEFAHLFDRPTELTDSQNGIKDWIMMFGSTYFNGISDEDKNDILDDIQNDLKESCFVNGKWFADYRRIRIVARKT